MAIGYASYWLVLQLVTIASLLRAKFAPQRAQQGPSGQGSAWWVQLGTFSFTFFSSVCSRCNTYSAAPMLIAMYVAAAQVYNALGHGVEQGRCSPRWLAVHTVLVETLLKMDEAVSDVVLHYMSGGLIISMFSSAMVVVSGRGADLHALVTVLTAPAFFVPLCLAGDGVLVARSSAATRAYRGPWVAESTLGRQLRLGLMCATGMRKGRTLRARGVGYLDRRACVNVLKPWINFMQVLINVQGQGHGGGNH